MTISTKCETYNIVMLFLSVFGLAAARIDFYIIEFERIDFS